MHGGRGGRVTDAITLSCRGLQDRGIPRVMKDEAACQGGCPRERSSAGTVFLCVVRNPLLLGDAAAAKWSADS